MSESEKTLHITSKEKKKSIKKRETETKSVKSLAASAKKIEVDPGRRVAKKIAKKKVTAVSSESNVSSLKQENNNLRKTNKELQEKVDMLQAQNIELRSIINYKEQSKISGVIGAAKGSSAVSPLFSEKESHISSRNAPERHSPSRSKSGEALDPVSPGFLPVTPWKMVLKKYYSNSAMMLAKQKLKFRDEMQSFLEDNLGRKLEIRCRFIDDSGHVDIGIPPNLVEKFVMHFNKKENAPKPTRSEELEAILNNNNVLPKRRITLTSEKSPRKKNVKIVTASSAE